MSDRRDWVGLTALALAVLIGGGWAAALIIAALHPEPTSEAGLAFLNNLGQTLATGVVAFLGYKVGAEASEARLRAELTPGLRRTP